MHKRPQQPPGDRTDEAWKVATKVVEVDAVAEAEEVLMKALRIFEVPEERIEAIEPSRLPESPPYFRATIRLEQQGLARQDRERPFSCFRQQNPVKWFSDAQAAGAARLPAGHRPPSRQQAEPRSRTACVDNRIVKDQSAAQSAPRTPTRLQLVGRLQASPLGVARKRAYG